MNRTAGCAQENSTMRLFAIPKKPLNKPWESLKLERSSPAMARAFQFWRRRSAFMETLRARPRWLLRWLKNYEEPECSCDRFRARKTAEPLAFNYGNDPAAENTDSVRRTSNQFTRAIKNI